MKKLFNIAVVLAFLFALVPTVGFAHTEDDPLVVNLLAGQTEDIGDIKVWNDGEYLYVQFLSDSCMIETHLHVATDLNNIPQTKKFNPIPGQFDYSTFHGCSKDYTYMLPLGDWGIDTPLFIAAHASLGAEETMTFYGDGDTEKTKVTAGNVPDAIYPYPAVDAWEAFDDPDDTVQSFWDQELVLEGSSFTFSLADWIWESYRVVDPTTTQYVTFEHEFNVPGYPTSGTLYIANDNTYSVSLNEVLVGDQTNYNNWPNVGKYEIYPLE
jgi:hypothetical protein